MFLLTALCVLAASRAGFVASLTLTTSTPKVKAQEGSGAVLSCSYTGNPEIVWKKVKSSGTVLVWKNGFLNDLKDRATITGADISIGKTVRTDNAVYRCEATEGTEFREVSVDLVIPVPPKAVRAEVPSSGTLGGTVRLVCSEPDAQPPPTYTWTRGGNLIFPQTPNNDPRFANTTYNLDPTGAVLTLSSLKLSDAGDYFCTATNEAGTLKSSTVQLAVYQTNHGAIAAAVIIPLLILCLIAIALFFAYRKGHLPVGKNRKQTTVQKPPAAMEYLSVADEGDFRHKPSFDL
ncbi:junctional adhesion molecule A-like [Lethenteron reissneri]|uniref:junctional adhesion molecule A-like n=1 Tax=Lethenteron reissneri TaxID=7753 RepID=UPI002AB6C752|nr:junctional adhesion molecule A-like [Lethenteron reissneri]